MKKNYQNVKTNKTIQVSSVFHINLLTLKTLGLILGKTLDRPLLHTILFSIYPILFLYSNNRTELSPSLLVVPIILSILLFALISLFFRALFRDNNKAAFASSGFILIFLSYENIHKFLVDSLKVKITNNDLLAYCLIIFIIFSLHLVGSTKRFHIVTRFLNIASISLVFLMLSIIIPYEVGIQLKSFSIDKSKDDGIQTSISRGEKRDIYYIILDSYGRQDILNEFWNHDNSEFINFLRDKGFYIADKSTSNYAFTHLSLPSTFNFEYLNGMTESLGKDRKTVDPELESIFYKNKAATFLKSEGYKFVTFDSGWWFTQNVPTADIVIGGVRSYFIFGKEIKISDFLTLFLKTTALSPYVSSTLTDKSRENILNDFNKLSDLDYVRENKFVLAHILLPHPPYLFDENGNNVPDGSPDGYDKKLDIGQLKYTNKLVEAAIEKILNKPGTKPIIIIAGDHGPLIPELELGPGMPSKEVIVKRMSILNAYYFPDKGESQLYESITPVNSFRVLFNYYFGTKYDLLEDRNYFSWPKAFYEFYEVTDQVRKNK